MLSVATLYLRRGWDLSLSLMQLGRKITHITHIVAVETFATFRYVLPAAFKWFVMEEFKQKFTLSVSSEDGEITAYAFVHGPCEIKADQEYTIVALAHGDLGHSFTTLPLAKKAQSIPNRVVVSIFIPSLVQDKYFKYHAKLFDMIVDVVEKWITDQKGIFLGVLAAGHSKGGMLIVQRQFDENPNPKILGTFSVAGPLKNYQNCLGMDLQGIFDDALNQRIIKFKERRKLTIVPQNDWGSERPAQDVRSTPHEPDPDCHVVPGMHLGALFSERTEELFLQFIQLVNPQLVNPVPAN